MPSYILVSYSCTHSAVLSANVEYNKKIYAEIFNKRARHVDADLDLTIHSHIAYPGPCPNDHCSRPSLIQWRERIEEAEVSLRAMLCDMKKQYISYGKIYHNIDPLAIVKCLKDPKCALAHRTFNQETRPCSIDPFLKPFRDFSQACMKIKYGLEDDSQPFSTSNAKHLSKLVNDCRYEASKLHQLLFRLNDGLDVIRDRRSALQDDKRVIVIDGLPIVHASMSDQVQNLVLDRLDDGDIDMDGHVHFYMPIDNTTQQTIGFAFIEYKTEKLANKAANIQWMPMNKGFKGHTLTLAKLTSVSRLRKTDIDRFRNNDEIPSSSQTRIDEMRENLRQEAAPQNRGKTPEALTQGATLEEQVAASKKAKRLSRRSKRGDFDDASKRLKVFAFHNAMYRAWLKRVDGL